MLHPVLLQRKSKQLRKIDPAKYAALIDKILRGDPLSVELIRPLHMLLLEPILVLAVTIHTGLIYRLSNALFEFIPLIFNESREIPVRLEGLLLIDTGIGTLLRAPCTVHISLWEKVHRLGKKWHGLHHLNNALMVPRLVAHCSLLRYSELVRQARIKKSIGSFLYPVLFHLEWLSP
jgi:hypothetical protein